ncbi:MAG: deoxyribose-phosphate aldolase [Oscillospiraceae bacterium]|nr:deoxyribose-phosphate aldolase [Oscillospiraceae bacterium]
MTNAEILSHIDHTILKPDAKWEDVMQICEEALQYHTASVCIPPWYVGQAKKAFPALNICTVVGFPLGYEETAAKAQEAELAIAAGAREIDMVINIAALKNGDDAAVLEDIKALRTACQTAILKVIVETCCLTEDEKIRVCRLVTEAGADYIKTSTGFGSAGAQLEDIALFRAHIGPDVKIKAAGGIRTREQMEAFLDAGCDRIGCSAARILFAEA